MQKGMPPYLPVYWIGPKPDVTANAFLNAVRLLYTLSVPLFPQAIGYYMTMSGSHLVANNPSQDPVHSAKVRVFPIETENEMTTLQDALAYPPLAGFEISFIDLNSQS